MSYPIKLTLKTEIVPLLILAAVWAAAAYFYTHFPPTVPIHWNVAGIPDGWGKGTSAALGFPAIITGIYVLFLAFPMLDPKKERYQEFDKVFHIFKASIVAAMSLIFVGTSLNILGYGIPVDKMVTVVIGLLFIIMGNYFGKIKFNWFMGVRTPWTLSSEEVWNKTHRVSGKIFMLSGLIMMAQGWLPIAWRLPAFIFMIIMLVFGTTVYSYFEYRRVKKNNSEENK